MTQEDCLFCKMATGAIPVDKLHDDELVFALRDIQPRAPVHLLIIPRQHVASSARELSEAHGALLGRMFGVASSLAASQGLAERGYRLAFNVGPDAGMTVHHLHLHLLGGRQLGPEG